jgi:hypothetical protein
MVGTASRAGRRLGHEAARVAVRETLSRISESGESNLSVKSSLSVSSLSGGETLESKAKDVCHAVARSNVAVTVIVFLFTFVLLCALNPPMAHSEDGSRSWKKITAWSSLTAFIALLIPLVKKS